MAKKRATTPVMVVRIDGSVGLRLGEVTATSGLVVVADCSACISPAAGVRHQHHRWHVQTTFGYLVGDLALTTRSDAHAAAAALGRLPIDWTDPTLSVAANSEARQLAISALARWGLTRAA